jgi:phosphoribosylformylglycinamidine cyclo-ligase
MMPEDDYDLAGFSVGIVDKERIIDRASVRPGDVMIALPSTGVHSNGFSLVRKVFGIGNGGENRTYPELEKSLWETLLTPTKIYVKPVLALLKEIQPKGISHITGGGFYENIPRALPEGCCAKIKKSDVRILPIFDIIAREGNIPERDMFNTFNMGVGMTITVSPEDAEKALTILHENGEPGAYVLGEIVAGEKGVELW